MDQWGETMTNVRCHGEIKIRCISNDCDCLQYAVTVLNSRNQIVYQGYTTDAGVTEFRVDAQDEYEIRVVSPQCMSPRVACRWVKLNPCETCGLYFVFRSPIVLLPVPKSTIHLTDQNYTNLPITKGEISLWPIQLM